MNADSFVYFERFFVSFLFSSHWLLIIEAGTLSIQKAAEEGTK